MILPHVPTIQDKLTGKVEVPVPTLILWAVALGVVLVLLLIRADEK